MSPRHRASVERDRVDPVGPWGHFVQRVLESHRPGPWPYEDAAAAVTREAELDGEPNARFDRYNIRSWLLGAEPRKKSWPWIVRGWKLSMEAFVAAIDEHRTWKANQRHAQALDQQPVNNAAPPANIDIPVYATLPSWVPPSPDSTNYTLETDWPARFGAQIVNLLTVVNDWQGPLFYADGLQAFLHRELMMFDALEPDTTSERAVYALSRRQALIALASLPMALAASPRATLTTPVSTDAFLSECAASLTACWHLLRGVDLSLVDQLLSTYLVPLASIAQRPSEHQHTAARLASQAHRICGIVALHRNELKARERHCQQAVHYADIAGDSSATVSALVSLASTHFYAGDPSQAALVYERALAHDQDIPTLQRSRIHAELSVVYGQLHREQDALRSLGVAEELYPSEPEQDRSFLYAEFTPASLALEQGLAFLALAIQYPGRGYEGKAMATFDRMQNATAGTAPDRIRFEIVNHQATTAILLNDFDAFESHFIDGIVGARRLQSKQRQREAVHAWRRAHDVWPREGRLKQLSDRFPQLPRESAS